MAKKEKTTSSSNSTSNSTSTPTVAPWLNSGYQNYGDQIAKYAQTDPSSYTTGPSAIQQQAFGAAGNLGSWKDMLGQGAQMATQAGQGTVAPVTATTAGAAQIANMDRSKYENPYLQSVVDTTLNDYDVNSGRTRAAQSASAGLNHAFGGSRYALREAQTEGELGRGRAAADANLRDQAFQQATAAMISDADRQQQSNMFNAGSTNQANQFNAGLSGDALQRQLAAAGLLGQFGQASGDQARGDLGAQLSAGQDQYAINQSQATALPTWLQSIGQLYGGVPISAFTSMNNTGSGTQNSTSTTKTSDPMGTIAGLAGAAGAIATGGAGMGLGGLFGAASGAGATAANYAKQAGDMKSYFGY